MDMATVDPDVQRAVAAARPRPPNYVPYIVKWLFAHGYLIAVLPIIAPIFLIRALIPNKQRLKQWSVRQAFDVFLIRYVLKVITAVRFQPLPPREHGLRESRGLIGSTLSFLNQSGPGGLAASLVVPAVEEAEEVAKYGNLSSDWFAPAPLHAFRGILSIKTPKNARTPVSGSETYKYFPVLEPKWANVRTKGYWFMQHHKPKPKPGAPGSQARPVLLYMRA